MDGMSDMSPAQQPSPMASTRIMSGSFYWGSDVVLFFTDWPSGHVGMYILALALLFTISVSYEFLANPIGYHGGNGSCAAAGLVETLQYTVRVASAYMLMLAIMSYNLGVFIVVIVGSAIGFYVFRRQHGRKEESKARKEEPKTDTSSPCMA